MTCLRLLHSTTVLILGAPVQQYREPSNHTYVRDARPQRESNAGVETFFEELMQEVIASERGGQWPLSSFTPISGRSPVPGLQDFSAEELRCNYYDLIKTGRPADSYIEWTKRLLENATAARQFLKNPTPKLWTLLEDMLTRKTVPSTSSNVKSTFRFDTGDGQGSIFGGSSSSQAAPSGNIFGQASGQNVFSQQPTENIFAQPVTGSIFGSSSTDMSSGIFSVVPSQSNVFSNNSQPQSAFGGQADGKNIFGNHTQFTPQPTSANSLTDSKSMFGGPVDPFGIGAGNSGFNTFAAQNTFGVGANAMIVSVEKFYSEPEDLTAEETEAFLSPKFSYGKIPLKPPTAAMSS